MSKIRHENRLNNYSNPFFFAILTLFYTQIFVFTNIYELTNAAIDWNPSTGAGPSQCWDWAFYPSPGMNHNYGQDFRKNLYSKSWTYLLHDALKVGIL